MANDRNNRLVPNDHNNRLLPNDRNNRLVNNDRTNRLVPNDHNKSQKNNTREAREDPRGPVWVSYYQGAAVS